MLSTSRQTKSRSGCQPCKRRRVKCDEAKPTCNRCMRRGETCTGNFDADTWQIERPWLYTLEPVSSRSEPKLPQTFTVSRTLNYAPGNDVLRHWFDHACLTMAIVPPPMNPLSYPISPYLHRSKAARHAIQCISQAHLHHFSTSQVVRVLEERHLALVALQHEIERVSRSTQPFYLRTILLSSLLLGISSSWVTPGDWGGEFLIGARHVVGLIIEQHSQRDPRDACLQYILGLYVWWEAVSSFITPRASLLNPLSRIKPVSWILQTVVDRYLISEVHPVTGIASSLFPVLAEVGAYYRLTVNTLSRDPATETALEARLLEWSPSIPRPDLLDKRWWSLWTLAQSYQAMGIIMLQQARSVIAELTLEQQQTVDDKVGSIMAMLRTVPLSDPLVNSEAPLLLVAGSELPADQPELRDLVARHVQQLTDYTRVTAFSSVFSLVQDVWRDRDNEGRITWLELMVFQGIHLSLA